KLSPDIVLHHLDKLHYKELIFRWKGHYVGYQLTHHGYDVLAFRVLAERDSVVAIGKEIGKGKESDVYLGFNEEKEKKVVKIHRVGRPSFQRSKKLRTYVGKRGHINWLYKSRLSAEQEAKGLEIANSINLKAPILIDNNRHMIVMDFYEGNELANLTDLPRPEYFLKRILEEIKKLTLQGNIIHGDLSEYNILIIPTADILIIDFPQFITMDHPNARELLTRDVYNVCRFFKRKYQLIVDIEETVQTLFAEYEK
ncbi:MAG: RIO1 family regulatory kinase/ATPase, partial [Asgard group archaeon]|nr:RIO1 family regulatory kinase/ATPase [Asgard group archaeon]